MYVCVHACVRACVCVCVDVRMCMCMCVYVDELLNSGGQFDQTCNLFGGAIPAQGLC